MKQIVTISGENLNVVMNNAEIKHSESKGKTKAQMRIEALKAAGVDTSNYFTLGDEQVVKAVDGAIITVTDDVQMIDAIGKKIVEGGYISNWSLFRRWVMAQMFRYLREMEERGKYFNELLQRHGYEYQWQMLERELYAQMKMEKHGDKENLEMRNMWFDGATASAMATDYIVKLQDYIEKNLIYRTTAYGTKKYKHTCKGNAYIRLQNKNIFVSDLQKKVYAPLDAMAKRMRYTTSLSELYKIVCEFNRTRKRFTRDTKQANAFIDAYKGSGAYFTMRNLIMFHKARFYKDGKFLSEEKSLVELEKKATECIDIYEPWRMLGILKQLIKDNNISIKGKIAEWER